MQAASGARMQRRFAWSIAAAGCAAIAASLWRLHATPAYVHAILFAAAAAFAAAVGLALLSALRVPGRGTYRAALFLFAAGIFLVLLPFTCPG